MGAPPCKGICDRFGTTGYLTGWFRKGYKRCKQCAICIRTDGQSCPCCGCRLRCKPTGAKYRRREVDRLMANGVGGRY